MRINKLFHWLYFVLMSLPIFAIGSACLISTFNMSTKEESEIHYKYETNEVNSKEDLILNRAYHFNFNNDIDTIFDNESSTFSFLFFNVDGYDFNDLDFDEYLDSYYQDYGLMCLILDIYSHQVYVNIYLTYNDSNDYIVDFVGDGLSNFYLEGDCIFLAGDNSQILSYNVFTKCQNIPIDYVETHNVLAQDVFYNSLDNVANSPLFTWAQASFLGVPVSYLGGIFGLASNSVINILLCYWVAISIIWLMFDVLMFVPMLVHKSIDKARF